MPKNKFQEVIFTIIMVFFMVYAMICYNISLNIGGMSNEVFLSAFHELIIMGPIAFILDFFLVGPIAKKKAFMIVNPQYITHNTDRKSFGTAFHDKFNRSSNKRSTVNNIIIP